MGTILFFIFLILNINKVSSIIKTLKMLTINKSLKFSGMNLSSKSIANEAIAVETAIKNTVMPSAIVLNDNVL